MGYYNNRKLRIFSIYKRASKLKRWGAQS